MATINFTIIAGILPVTASIVSEDFSYSAQLVAPEYGEYSFTDLPTNNYTISISDTDGCISSRDVSVSHECLENEIMTVDGCVSYVEESPTVESTPYTIEKAGTDDSYTIYGGVIITDYDIDGTGTVEHFNNDYISNIPYPSDGGVLNETGIWSSTENANQEIMLSTTIDLVVPETYYIGFASGGEVTVKINGVEIISQDVTEIRSMISDNGLSGAYDDTVLYKYWFIYPIELGSGKNVIEIISNNESGVSVLGAQIYDATEYEIINAQTKEDLSIVFTSEDTVGETLPYEDSTTGGTHGYTCPEGYALDVSGLPVCVKKTSTNVVYTEQGYGLLYNWYAAADPNISSSAAWFVPSYAQQIDLLDYLDAAGALKETGTEYWNSPNTGAANLYYFAARGSGNRRLNIFGGFTQINTTTNWWSSTEQAEDSAFKIGLSSTLSTGGGSNTLKVTGLSVRLVSDAAGVPDGVTTTYVGNNGVLYYAVAINGLYWLVNSLRETHLRGGSIIPWYGANPANYFTNIEWDALDSPGVCVYGNNESYVTPGFQFPALATTTTTTSIPATTTTTTPDPLATTTTTTEGVFSFDVTTGNFPVDACGGTPRTIYSSQQTPTVGTIMYLDAALSQPYNIPGGGSVLFVSPELFGGRAVYIVIVPVTLSMGEIMLVSGTVCNPVVVTTTTTTTAEIDYDAIEREPLIGMFKFVSKNLFGNRRELDISDLNVNEVHVAMNTFCGYAYSFYRRTEAYKYYAPKNIELFVGLYLYKYIGNANSEIANRTETVIVADAAWLDERDTLPNIFPCGYGEHLVLRIENGYITAITTIVI